jgi:hypothetical protein
MTAPILYVRDGSRFVPIPDTLLRDCPPIPEPQPVPEDTQDRYYRVPAPRCPHGHFARWAARNCCKETRRAR